MDLPLRAKLQMSMVGTALLGGVLMVVTGSLLIRHLVVAESSRRAIAGLETAQAALQDRQERLESVCAVASQWLARHSADRGPETVGRLLGAMLDSGSADFMVYLDSSGRQIWPTSAARTRPVAAMQAAGSALSVMPVEALSAMGPGLVERARIGESRHASPQALVLEAWAPVVGAGDGPSGLVRAGVLLNRNNELVDSVRNVAFGRERYRGQVLGTVTLFAGDMRVATNVTDATGRRAIGTRLSPAVARRVLEQGLDWVGPANVVGVWYVSAYRPLMGSDGRPAGVIYAGVLKRRYDDLQRAAVLWMVTASVLSALAAAAVGRWRADRMARPLDRLVSAARQIEQGNLECRLPEPGVSRRDEIRHLTSAFNQMACSLMERDEQLHESHEQLVAAAHDLERSNQSYLDTLGFITHELKSQVSTMKINLLAVRDGYVGPVEDEQREALDDVLSALNRTEEMILSYLNLSRIEQEDLVVRSHPVRVLNDVVVAVLRDLKARLDASQMRVQVDLAPELVVQADPGLLRIVYENLISNAAKYGRPGGLLRVWGERTDDAVNLHVWNEGDGVPYDQTDALFRRFSRIQSEGEQVQGAGLGLFITREIVRKLGGEITAVTCPGEGIDFVFSLPRPDVLLGEPEDTAAGDGPLIGA